MNKGKLSLVVSLVIYLYFVEAQNDLSKPDKPNVLVPLNKWLEKLGINLSEKI